MRRDGRAVLRLTSPAALEAVAPFLGKPHHAAVQEDAVRAFKALASLEPDAAWYLLFEIVRGDKSGAPATPPLAPGLGPSGPNLLAGTALLELELSRISAAPGARFPLPASLVARAADSVFPSLELLLPPMQRGGSGDTDFVKTLDLCRIGQCGPRAAALLAAVAEISPSWTDRVILPQV